MFRMVALKFKSGRFLVERSPRFRFTLPALLLIMVAFAYAFAACRSVAIDLAEQEKYSLGHGRTTEHVRAVLGEPAQITPLHNGSAELWSYPDAGVSIAFREGRSIHLFAIQRPSPRR
jgi:hypothetical protein